MDSSLKRIIKLIKKTGDRFIVTDADYELPYVVMSLDSYEKIILTEKVDEPVSEEMSELQLLEKINNDIAVWKSQQEKVPQTVSNFVPEEKKEVSSVEEVVTPLVENSVESAPTKEEGAVEDHYYFEPLES